MKSGNHLQRIGLVLILLAGIAVSAAGAEALFFEPVPLLEKMAAAGPVKGVDPQTGREAQFWVKAYRYNGVPASGGKPFHAYHFRCNIQKPDGTWIVNITPPGEPEASFAHAISSPPIQKFTTRKLLHREYTGEGGLGWRELEIDFDRQGNLARVEFRTRLPIKVNWRQTILFGDERTRFLFDRAHRE
ncbi:MAG: hypothetical protein GX442_24340 [Candidatus Riflebacteria bacterium]|nr:hypothetical protein [Candidatus Riflebacteria bacterium]